ncbi:hypothetical protein QEV83_07795 [Methylocapsa sp. D3K7]|uniref:hypothetical protein n=1 Tax=Methylocapsa sp. D3K7 TaxID=3041435 RepID=UPI00244E97A4|nr:hypothetical protein [Methylocapsa sp. D3K7]WGJ16134.1 hypothetical protein QEV83_07795 [Methylocapsa sp. D3K7]
MRCDMARVRINNGPTIETEGSQTAMRAPSIAERIKADANRIEYENDVTGRRIGVRQLDFLAVHDLTVDVGGELASNGPAFNQILAVASVAEIDGDPVDIPASHLQVRAIMKRLGFHGVKAAMSAVSRFGGLDEDLDAIKNS